MKDRASKNIILIVLILVSTSIFSQQNDYITGKLLDAKTQEPIAFASIRIKDRALGTISNADGSFKIPLKYKTYGDIIEMSSMGYQTKEILISDFSIYEINNIRLEPAIFELEEAIVSAKKARKRALSAKQIVRRAIYAIVENYPVTPYSQVGYYRDYQLDKGEYVNLNEAILEVFDQGFKTIDTTTTRTRIYNYLQNNEFRRDTISERPYDYKKRSKIIDNAYMSGYGGNEFSTLKVHDAIRNYELNTFDFINGLKDGDILKNHSFKKAADSSRDNKLLYVVRLERNKYAYSARGKVYISKDDFAIHKLEYAIYDNSKKNTNEKLREAGIKGKLIMEVITEYKRTSNDKMYLNYISFHNTFRLQQAPKFALKFLGLNLDKKQFVLTFNNNIDAEYALDYSNYKGYFKEEAIKFKSLIHLDNQIFLHPKLNTKKQLLMWEVLKAAGLKETLNQDLLDFKVNYIKDVDGNLINLKVSKNYDQFREFFVQEIKLNPQVPIDSLFMHNRKPIFKNQPIAQPENADDYWMNTPLKKSQ